MNEIAAAILAEQEDVILPRLKSIHDQLALRARKWLENKEQLLPVLHAFIHIGASVDVDSLGRIDVKLAGDKAAFIKAWKLWRSVGIRLDPAAKGATEISQFVEPFGVVCWFYFTSTVCKRVQVGTRTVKQPVYETQCGTDLNNITQNELEGPVHAVVSVDPPPFADDIPF